MARKKTAILTDGEVRIMEVIWNRPEASVREVMEQLTGNESVAYSTVQTMLGILEEKGYVSHRKEGRAFIYAPVVSRGEARSHAVRYLVRRFFDDSPTALAQNLLAEEDVDLLELERLQKSIEDPEDPE